MQKINVKYRYLPKPINRFLSIGVVALALILLLLNDLEGPTSRRLYDLLFKVYFIIAVGGWISYSISVDLNTFLVRWTIHSASLVCAMLLVSSPSLIFFLAFAIIISLHVLIVIRDESRILVTISAIWLCLSIYVMMGYLPFFGYSEIYPDNILLKFLIDFRFSLGMIVGVAIMVISISRAAFTDPPNVKIFRLPRIPERESGHATNTVAAFLFDLLNMFFLILASIFNPLLQMFELLLNLLKGIIWIGLAYAWRVGVQLKTTLFDIFFTKKFIDSCARVVTIFALILLLATLPRVLPILVANYLRSLWDFYGLVQILGYYVLCGLVVGCIAFLTNHYDHSRSNAHQLRHGPASRPRDRGTAQYEDLTRYGHRVDLARFKMPYASAILLLGFYAASITAALLMISLTYIGMFASQLTLSMRPGPFTLIMTVIIAIGFVFMISASGKDSQVSSKNTGRGQRRV
jgi:hypothetical protein